ncbi:MAG: hypothetical protein JSR68_08425 [Proteobacteria bacterium]|nr:hypothetical protein [Pseudomonadota bacterium]
MKEAANYVPREGSVPWRVVEFLTTNPDETLLAEDVAAKFGCGVASVHTVLRQAVASGSLVRAENRDGELEYRLGAGVPVIEPAPHKHPVLGHVADVDHNAVAPAIKSKRRPAFTCDINQVQIDHDVPLKAINERTFDFAPLLARLQPGDSFALPREANSAIASAITRYSKAHGVTLAKRSVDGGLRIRVWRIK